MGGEHCVNIHVGFLSHSFLFMSTDQLQPHEISALVAHLKFDIPLSAELRNSLAEKLQSLMPDPIVRAIFL
jgi:hypothetical protein